MAFGMGVMWGMGVTLRHFFETYTLGHNKQPAAAGNVPAPAEATVADRMPAGMPTATGGLFTLQYPDQKLPVPERFRYIPFLLYEEEPDSERVAFDGIRCTACGICAKVCPPQCIWIVQGKGADGRPRPVATEFYIDAAICMSCGFCSEYCPFDAIKMDHDYEFSSYERHESWVFDIQELLHPVAYHAAIHPADHARELEEQRQKEEAKRKKEEAAAAARAQAAGEGGIDAEEARRRKMEARQRMLDAKAKREAEKGGGEA